MAKFRNLTMLLEGEGKVREKRGTKARGTGLGPKCLGPLENDKLSFRLNFPTNTCLSGNFPWS